MPLPPTLNGLDRPSCCGATQPSPARRNGGVRSNTQRPRDGVPAAPPNDSNFGTRRPYRNDRASSWTAYRRRAPRRRVDAMTHVRLHVLRVCAQAPYRSTTPFSIARRRPSISFAPACDCCGNSSLDACKRSGRRAVRHVESGDAPGRRHKRDAVCGDRLRLTRRPGSLVRVSRTEVTFATPTAGPYRSTELFVVQQSPIGDRSPFRAFGDSHLLLSGRRS